MNLHSATRKKRLLLSMLVASCGFIQFTQASPILTYTFGDGAPANQTLSPTNVAANITVSPLLLGPGMTNTQFFTLNTTANTPSGSPAFQQASGGWTATFDDTKYFGFTIEPDEGYMLTLDTFTFYTSKNAGGADNWEVRTSLDGFTNTVDSGSGIYQGTPGAAEWTNPTVNLGLTNETNLVEIRLYFFNGNTTATGNARVDDLMIDGTVQLVPEAQSSLLMLFGLILILGLRHRLAENMQVRIPIICLSMLFFVAQTNAAVLALYPFTSSSLASTDVDANSTASAFTAGPGIGTQYNFSAPMQAGNTTSGAHSIQAGAGIAGSGFDGWDAGLNATEYFSFSVTLDPGYRLHLTQLDFFTSKNNNGANVWEVRSSIDGFSSTLGSGTPIVQGSPVSGSWTVASSSFDLQSYSAVEFRIYGYTGGTGTGSGNWRLDDVMLTGETFNIIHTV